MQRYRTLYQNASKYLEEKFWTGSRRYNASHFYYGNKTLNIPDEKSCFHGFSSIKQFRSSVILTRKNTTYFAVRFTFCLFYNFFHFRQTHRLVQLVQRPSASVGRIDYLPKSVKYSSMKFWDYHCWFCSELWFSLYLVFAAVRFA